MNTWRKGLIYWFANNPVAANLLMIVIILGGITSALTLRKEMFPTTTIDVVNVTVAFPGAAPEEVEEGVCLKIEQAITGVEGIDKINCTANENIGTASIEIDSGYELDEITNEVKNKIDGINSFPNLVEKPVISQVTNRMQAIFISLYGTVDEKELRSFAFDTRDQIIDIPGISSAQVVGATNLEVHIEVSENTLRQYNLTFDEIARAIRSNSLDLPAGAIKSKKGDVLLRALGQADTENDFSRIVVRSDASGSLLKLGDIAKITDGFAESSREARFNGLKSISIRVDAIGNDDIIEVAESVKRYVAEKQSSLPDGIQMSHWSDISHYVNGRVDLMLKNLFLGAILVLIILTLFLKLKVAFWVMIGLPVAFLGTLLLMPYFGVTINMLSLFAFILVLGIVVDDAIVIGESSYDHIEEYGHSMESVVTGAQKVALPATFGVLTTIAAFTPLLFVGGIFGSFFESIVWVVVLNLIFSLIESKLILPAHLTHVKVHQAGEKRGFLSGFIAKIQHKMNSFLERFINNRYKPLLEKALKRPFLSTWLFIAVFILSLSLVTNGFVRVVMNPDFAADFIFSQVQMNEGTSDEDTEAALTKIENAIHELDKEVSAKYGKKSGVVLEHVFVVKQSQLSGQIIAELVKDDAMVMDGNQVLNLWKEKIGDIIGAENVGMGSLVGPGQGPEIAFKLFSPDPKELSLASAELAEKISQYPGVSDVRNSMREGKDEVQFTLKPRGQNLGLTQESLARQIRQAFYGEEIQRLQRGIDEVKVMLKYPLSERESTATLDTMRIRLPDGTAIPLSSVADISVGKSSNQISRTNRKRASTISGDADLKLIDPNTVVKELTDNFINSEMRTKYPSVVSATDGVAKEMMDLMLNLAIGFGAALLLIYVLMAIPLKSYSQPLIIMSVIPFGITGAIVGHWVTGYTMSMISLFGIIALSGVVVNDSLVMVDFINKYKAQGKNTLDAAKAAGVKRFRAILLTSLTTFFGLLPMLLETSLQAKVIIPMAISLAFGILFATVITLILIPVWYMILFQIKEFFSGASEHSIQDKLNHLAE